MNAKLIQAVMRGADALTPDADLLARFTASRDGPAFEELVRRHGPLVWAVCRQLLSHHADAEDAFQAVFLALVRGCRSVRRGEALPAWLHGVAVRVATRAKRSAVRRRQREERAAVPEANRPVADSAWAAVMAAVHEEVQHLPDAERTAFVLCELEGVRQPDAAARLGWPLGTLSGRLCKARQHLLERLGQRGIAPMVLAVGGLGGSAGSVPASLISKVLTFPTAGAAGLSSTVTPLAHGLIEGVTMRTKLTVAALLVAGALGVTGGGMVLSRSDAQAPTAPSADKGRPPIPANEPPKPTPAPAQPDHEIAGLGTRLQPAPGRVVWEYKFVDQSVPHRAAFEKLLADLGNDSWEYVGYEVLIDTNATEDARKVLIFKRPKGVAGGENLFQVFRLKQAAADDVVAAIKKVFTTNVRVVAERESNAVIVISADPDTLKELTKVIEALDVKPADKPRPTPAAGTLPPAAVPNTGLPPGIRSYADVSSAGTTRLPAAPPKPAVQLNVFELKKANAADMAEVLKKLFPAHDFVADLRTNTVITRADPETLEQVRMLIARLEASAAPAKANPGNGRPPSPADLPMPDTIPPQIPPSQIPQQMPPGFPPASDKSEPGSGFGGAAGGGERQSQVFKLRFITADDAVTTIQNVFPNKPTLIVQAEPVSNTLVVATDAATLKDIVRLVEMVDTKDRAEKHPAGRSDAGYNTNTGALVGGGTGAHVGIGTGAVYGAAVGPLAHTAKPDALNVVALKHATATEMAAVLKKAFPNVEVTAEARSNRLILRVDAKTLDEIKELIKQLDVEGADNIPPAAPGHPDTQLWPVTRSGLSEKPRVVAAAQAATDGSQG